MRLLLPYYDVEKEHYPLRFKSKAPFTSSGNWSESEKDQRTNKKYQRIKASIKENFGFRVRNHSV